jgi:hypothetical protein
MNKHSDESKSDHTYPLLPKTKRNASTATSPNGSTPTSLEAMRSVDGANS